MWYKKNVTQNCQITHLFFYDVKYQIYIFMMLNTKHKYFLPHLPIADELWKYDVICTVNTLFCYTSFFSRLHSDMALSPCSWNVMIIKATKMLTKKKGKTTK